MDQIYRLLLFCFYFELQISSPCDHKHLSLGAATPFRPPLPPLLPHAAASTVARRGALSLASSRVVASDAASMAAGAARGAGVRRVTPTRRPSRGALPRRSPLLAPWRLAPPQWPLVPCVLSQRWSARAAGARAVGRRVLQRRLGWKTAAPGTAEERRVRSGTNDE